MRWSVSEAKQQFSAVVKSAVEEPQLIFNRDELVAAVVDATTLKEFEAWRQARRASLADRFSELRRIAEEEGGDGLLIAERRDRSNPFAGELDDVSG